MDSSNPYQAPVASALGAVTKLNPKQVLLTFEGRIPRKTYWIFTIGLGIIFGILYGIILAIAGPSVSQSASGQMVVHPPGVFFYLLFMLLSLATLWPGLAIQIKRWHDLGKPGIWVLINLIPIAGPIWALVQCGFMRGTVGPNQFGADPTEPG